jgi:TonB family protein
MYFNFEDYRPDTPTLPRSLTRLEVGLLTLVFYLSVVIMLLVWPHLDFVKAWEAERQQELAKLQQEQIDRQKESARFVFVPDRMPAPKPPPRADLSDANHKAAQVERAPNPTNNRPFSRGNTFDTTDGSHPSPKETSDASQPQPAAEAKRDALTLPESPTGLEPKTDNSRGPAVGVIADAIRNIQKYQPSGQYVNLQGDAGQNFDKTFQFDTKGVDFGSWLRRFKATVERHWLIPTAAMFQKGHVVITCVIWKDGRITDVRVVGPSGIESFDHSSFGALTSASPVPPLPPEYPDDHLTMTVTFFYNENPGS